MRFCLVLASFLICLVTFLMIAPAYPSFTKQSISTAFSYPDALTPPDLQARYSKLLGSSKAFEPALDSSPGYAETSEYLIGSVAVGIIFLESNGSIDPSTESWTSARESSVVNEIYSGLSWLASYNPDAHVSFAYDIQYQVPTSYEPINHPTSDEHFWISDAMTYLGYHGTSYFTQVRNYINDLRKALGTNWAFAIFVVDSYNDVDGEFTDGYSAYAYLGGPFLVMTYDNDGYHIGHMNYVVAHETAHIFYATDEYNGVTEYSGYLNVKDNEGSGDMMETALSWWFCDNSKEQLGWRDMDGDKIQDIVDTLPKTTLSAFSPDPTNDSTPTYKGYIEEIPYPNNNPNPWDSHRDVTVNTIANVQYKVDSGTWHNASATDGLFDETGESFNFTVISLSSGIHVIEARGRDSVGNAGTSFASDSLTIDLTSPITSIIYSSPSFVKGSTTYVTEKTNFAFASSGTISGVAGTYYKIDSDSWRNHSTEFSLSGVSEGAHTVYFYSVDGVGNVEASESLNVFLDQTGPTVSFVLLGNGTMVSSFDINATWNGVDDASGIDHYETKLDNEGYFNEGTFTSQRFSTITEGNHRIYVKALDKLGNSREFSLDFLVDVSAPIISNMFPKNGEQLRSSTMAINWYGQDEISGIDHYEVQLDANSWISTGLNTTYKFNQVSDGTHTVHIKAVDKAGNNQTAQFYFTVNTSLIGGPGWIDDAAVLGAISAAIIATAGFLIKKRSKKKLQTIKS